MPDAASSETIATEPRFVPLETGLEAARAASRRGDLVGVLAGCTTLRQTFPNSAEPYALASETLTDHHHFDESDLLLEVATERFPGDAALAAAFAGAAAHKGDIAASLRRWEKASGAFPDDLAVAAGWAAALRDAGQFGAAETLLLSLQARYPNDPLPLLERARTALARRNPGSAVALWRTAQERFPDLGEAYTGGAKALREAERFAEADALLTEAIARFPNAADPPIEHARTAAAQRDWPEATRRWESVRDRHPADVRGYAGQANVWRDMGQFDAADAVLTEALVRFPDNIDLLTAYAQLAQTIPDWPEAVARWEHIRTLFPGHVGAYLQGIVALRDAGRQGEAESLAVEAQRRFQSHAGPERAYARLAQARRDWPAANTRWDRAKARFPDAIDIYLDTARCLREQDKAAAADAILRQAEARFPDRPEPLLALADLAPPDAAGALWDQLRSRFPWLFAAGEAPLETQALPLPAAGRSGPLRLVVTGFHLAYQISLLFGRMLPYRGKISVAWINAGMDVGAAQFRLPDATDLYFEESMVGDAATRRLIRDLLPATAAVRTFPTSTMRVLWPFLGPDSRLVPEPPVYHGGRYVDPDAVAATLANPELTDDALFDMYMEITEAAPLDLDALHAADLDRLAAEDQDRDVRLAPFTGARFRDELLFAAPHERCTPVVKEVARQLLETPLLRDICDLDTALAGLDRLTLGWRAHGRALPVHPRVARHFGLAWWSPDMMYDLGHNSFSFREYTIRYLRWSPWLV